MINKFKVGDKVVPVSKSFGDSFDKCKHAKKLKANEVNFLYVVGFQGELILLNSDKTSFNTGSYYKEEDLKKFISKNQRITKLEEEVAELKLIVHQLRKPSTEVSEALSATTVEDKPFFAIPDTKSPNQLRAEIIEKAKAFVLDEKQKRRASGEMIEVYINRKTLNWVNAEFIVNEEKRTIACLIRWTKDNSLDGRGIAKCMPSDVFNEHIGKAIALGRALGLDVSEFERAVQPTEKVIGQIVSYEYTVNNKGTFEVHEIKKNGVSDKAIYDSDGYWSDDKNCKIINDTNAIYDGEVVE